MKSFHDIEYVGIDVEHVNVRTKEITDAFNDAESFERQVELFDKMTVLKSDVYTQGTLAMIRHSMDTTDVFYKKEKAILDEQMPQLGEAFNLFSRALVDAKFRPQLEEKYGPQLFRLKDLELRTFSPEIVGELQEENRLTTAYSQLIASAKIRFDGKEYTLAQLQPFEQDPDRSVRERAVKARTSFMHENEAELDRIYDELVAVRTKIAKKLGFENFIGLAYARMSRTDYGPDQVIQFRKQVRDHIVPLASRLWEEQRQRIGVDSLMYYDEGFQFPDGNPKPKGDDDWVLEQGRVMYDELSAETKDFYRLMLEQDLMDVQSRDGKESGGYCTFLPNENVPFVFANFNGTAGDVGVLTHEIGHALQNYESRDLGVMEYLVPTMEAAEIHSMSMEYFTYPWMNNIFKEDTDKYLYSHIAGEIQALPYIVAVDEFQHIVYANPEMTPAERKLAWKSLEETYLPHKNYGGNEYLGGGALWQRQLHIYGAPFYYIDYSLAQICAMQFWKRMNEDREAAWNDYLALCKLGGSKSFTELVKSAGLTLPFEDGCVKDVVEEVESWLETNRM
ncbi:M3 family oligoendopeptidase [Geomicrobium sp. JSM 1781026]|uniref:M3 family oligoendopeptidase n=1 Tax=Geomicrobium sp. JSM 1781026 TaxID=3344580 RepID=UPI0035C24F5E